MMQKPEKILKPGTWVLIYSHCALDKTSLSIGKVKRMPGILTAGTICTVTVLLCMCVCVWGGGRGLTGECAEGG